jgi:hypothetical protein
LCVNKEKQDRSGKQGCPEMNLSKQWINIVVLKNLY